MWNQKRNDTNELTKQRLTDLENELIVARRKDGGRESQGAWDGHGHTAVFNMENQLLDSTGNSAQYSVITLWSPGGRMEEGIVRESRMDMDTLLCLT